MQKREKCMSANCFRMSSRNLFFFSCDRFSQDKVYTYQTRFKKNNNTTNNIIYTKKDMAVRISSDQVVFDKFKKKKLQKSSLFTESIDITSMCLAKKKNRLTKQN